MGDGVLTARPLYALGVHSVAEGQYEEAERRFREMVAVEETTGNLIRARIARRELAEVFYRSGRYERARPLLEEVLAQSDETGDIPGLAHSQILLGGVLMSQGQYQLARAQGEMGLATSRRVDWRWQIGWSLDLLARLAPQSGHGTGCPRYGLKGPR